MTLDAYPLRVWDVGKMYQGNLCLDKLVKLDVLDLHSNTITKIEQRSSLRVGVYLM